MFSVYVGIRALIMSRVILGTAKQTSTISTSMLASYTILEVRATYMGRLTASVTLAFILGPTVGAYILGPTVGAYLHKNVDKRAPAILESCLFVFNFFLASILLPDEQPRKEVVKSEEKMKKGNKFHHLPTIWKRVLHPKILALLCCCRWCIILSIGQQAMQLYRVITSKCSISKHISGDISDPIKAHFHFYFRYLV